MPALLTNHYFGKLSNVPDQKSILVKCEMVMNFIVEMIFDCHFQGLQQGTSQTSCVLTLSGQLRVSDTSDSALGTCTRIIAKPVSIIAQSTSLMTRIRVARLSMLLGRTFFNRIR